MKLSVIIPTFNPDRERLRRTLLGLCCQSLPLIEWETIVVNNASTRFPEDAFFSENAPSINFKILVESNLGLTSARRCGFHAARGDLAVMVDDDNILAPDYLENVLTLFAKHPSLGVGGGRSLPEFEVQPSDWATEFFPLLAIRDLGTAVMIADSLRPPGAVRDIYPVCAPIGAGMALRRSAWQHWMEACGTHSPRLSDRRGTELTSAGDNDIIFCALKQGEAVGYFPSLSLTHLIPASRLDPTYLGRLNKGIQKSWHQLLLLHHASAWTPIPNWTVPLRKAKAWLTYQAWRGGPNWIRWQGACGHFEGLVSSNL